MSDINGPPGPLMPGPLILCCDSPLKDHIDSYRFVEDLIREAPFLPRYNGTNN